MKGNSSSNKKEMKNEKTRKTIKTKLSNVSASPPAKKIRHSGDNTESSLVAKLSKNNSNFSGNSFVSIKFNQ